MVGRSSRGATRRVRARAYPALLSPACRCPAWVWARPRHRRRRSQLYRCIAPSPSRPHAPCSWPRVVSAAPGCLRRGHCARRGRLPPGAALRSLLRAVVAPGCGPGGPLVGRRGPASLRRGCGLALSRSHSRGGRCAPPPRGLNPARPSPSPPVHPPPPPPGGRAPVPTPPRARCHPSTSAAPSVPLPAPRRGGKTSNGGAPTRTVLQHRARVKDARSRGLEPGP